MGETEERLNYDTLKKSHKSAKSAIRLMMFSIFKNCEKGEIIGVLKKLKIIKVDYVSGRVTEYD